MTNEAEERLDTAFAEIFDSLVSEIHTCMPGQVTAFDASAQTVSVRPCLKRKFLGEADPVELPVIEDVPVVYPGSGDLWLVFPVEVDSYVLLVFSERAIASWMNDGGVVDPTANRKFKLSDAIAIPGMLPTPVQFSGSVESGEISLRTADGTKKAAFDSGGTLTVNDSTDAAALASKVDNFITAVHLVMGTSWVPVPNDGGAALQLAWRAQFGTPPVTASVESTNIKTDS